MAKRFTETKKWDDTWFQQLTPKHKLAWLYICDRCDESGFIELSYGILGAYVGELIDGDALRADLGARIVHVKESKFWIPSFITFQYKTLNPDNKAQLGIIRKVVEGLEKVDLPPKVLELTVSWGVKEALSPLRTESLDSAGNGKGIGNGLGKETYRTNKDGVVFETQRLQQEEFKKLCLEQGLDCRLEFYAPHDDRNCRFDAVIFRGEKLAAILEFKKYIGREPRTDTKQLARYRSFNVPVFLIKRDHSLADVVSELCEFFKRGRKSKYQIPDMPPSFNLEDAYKEYPRKIGKSEGLKRLALEIKNEEDYHSLLKAISKYKDHCKTSKLEAGFIKHFSSFVSNWRDWLDPQTGQAEDFARTEPSGIDFDKICGARQGATP